MWGKAEGARLFSLRQDTQKYSTIFLCWLEDGLEKGWFDKSIPPEKVHVRLTTWCAEQSKNIFKREFLKKDEITDA